MFLQYEKEIQQRALEVRAGFPADHLDNNWSGLIMHEQDECLQCDAYRLLQREEDESS